MFRKRKTIPKRQQIVLLFEASDKSDIRHENGDHEKDQLGQKKKRVWRFKIECVMI